MANHKIKCAVVTDKGNSFDVMLPAKRVVCHRCDGSGFHVNPSVDGHGLSSDDFDQDPDFREAYFSGRYDVECEECKGERVVLEVHWERLTPKMQKRLQRAIDEDYWLDKAEADERKWGC